MDTNGNLQTPIEESYTAIPPLALAKVATVMASGTRKYGPRNWYKISVSDHLDHAIRHAYLYIMGDTTDEPDGVTHLAHMACRALMALECAMIDKANEEMEENEDDAAFNVTYKASNISNSITKAAKSIINTYQNGDNSAL